MNSTKMLAKKATNILIQQTRRAGVPITPVVMARGRVIDHRLPGWWAVAAARSACRSVTTVIVRRSSPLWKRIPVMMRRSTPMNGRPIANYQRRVGAIKPSATRQDIANGRGRLFGNSRKKPLFSIAGESSKSREAAQIKSDPLKQMIKIEQAITSPLEYLELVIESFHKATCIAIAKIIRNAIEMSFKQVQKGVKAGQAARPHLLHPLPQLIACLGRAIHRVKNRRQGLPVVIRLAQGRRGGKKTVQHLALTWH